MPNRASVRAARAAIAPQIDSTRATDYIAKPFNGAVVRARFVRGERRRRQNIVESADTLTDRFYMLLSFVGMQVIPAVYLFSHRLEGTDYRASDKTRAKLGLLGTGVFAAALLLFAPWTTHDPIGDTTKAPENANAFRSWVVIRGTPS